MAERGRVLTELKIYADPAEMKARYGVEITVEQVRLANKTLEYYRAIPSKELEKMPDEQALRWPYRFSSKQRLDALIHTSGVRFTIPQTILWKTLRETIDASDYQDGDAVIRAVQDLEGFMQMNAYTGNFRENRDLVDNAENKLAILFAMAYSSHHRP